MSHLIFEKLPSQLKRDIIHKTERNYPTLNDSRRKLQSEHYCCQDFLKNNRRDNKYKNSYKGKEDTEKQVLQNFTTYFQKPFCVLCDMNSHKLSSCKKCFFFEERKKWCERLNLCSKCTNRKHKNEDYPGIKNGWRLACLKCNSKCHISALCDKPKTTPLYTSLGINQNNDGFIVILAYSNEARRMAINCILNTESQRSYFSSNITYYLLPSKGQKRM